MIVMRAGHRFCWSRARANLLLCAVAVCCSSLFGAKPALGQALPPKARAVKVDDADDSVVLQFEQQWGRQLRQVYRTEIHFMRSVCQPTKSQYEKITAGGPTALKALSKKLAANMRHGLVNETSDPRVLI